MFDKFGFYSHVNCSVTKITVTILAHQLMFYSHVNYSVTKIIMAGQRQPTGFTVT